VRAPWLKHQKPILSIKKEWLEGHSIEPAVG
jgi:hypothetical protein